MNTPEQPTQWKLFWQIFHKLWGQNKAGDYSKATWMDFQEMALDLQDAAKRVEPSVVAKTDSGIKEAAEDNVNAVLQNTLSDMLDTAGVATGNGERKYTLLERIEGLVKAKDYFAAQTEDLRSRYNWNGLCRCGHFHIAHSAIKSFNYTAGPCSVKSCKCRAFVIGDQESAAIDGNFEWLRDCYTHLKAAYDQHRRALKRASETIRIWHGEEAWEQYQHSPEMNEINNALRLACPTLQSSDQKGADSVHDGNVAGAAQVSKDSVSAQSEKTGEQQ